MNLSNFSAIRENESVPIFSKILLQVRQRITMIYILFVAMDCSHNNIVLKDVQLDLVQGPSKEDEKGQILDAEPF